MSYHPRLIQLMKTIKESEKTKNHSDNVNWRVRGSLTKNEQLEVNQQMKRLRKEREHWSNQFHTD
jgi:hypothetical protein